MTRKFLSTVLFVFRTISFCQRTCEWLIVVAHCCSLIPSYTFHYLSFLQQFDEGSDAENMVNASLLISGELGGRFQDWIDLVFG